MKARGDTTLIINLLVRIESWIVVAICTQPRTGEVWIRALALAIAALSLSYCRPVIASVVLVLSSESD